MSTARDYGLIDEFIALREAAWSQSTLANLLPAIEKFGTDVKSQSNPTFTAGDLFKQGEALGQQIADRVGVNPLDIDYSPSWYSKTGFTDAQNDYLSGRVSALVGDAGVAVGDAAVAVGKFTLTTIETLVVAGLVLVLVFVGASVYASRRA